MKPGVLFAAVFIAGLCGAAYARVPKKKSPPQAPSTPVQVQGRGTLQVEARMSCRGKEIFARLLTLDGVQSNFAQKDPTKNTSFVFNFQPNVADSAKDEIELQYQFECSELDKPSSTSQVQGVARVQSAVETTIADSDSVQLRVKLSVLKAAH